MKKLIALLLVLAMVFGLVACGAKEEAASATEAAKEEAASVTEAAKEDAALENAEPIVLDIVPHTNGWVAVQDTPTEKLIEERFNVEINTAEVDTWQADTTAVYLAGSPDFDFIAANANFDTYSSYYEQGLLRTFTYEELCEHMPNWMAALEQDLGQTAWTSEENSRASIEASHNGELFVIPKCELPSYYVMAIRQDWLDNLNLKVPTTYEELVDVMVAFTYDDPDGNGIDDTYAIDCHSVYRLNYLHLIDGVLQDTFVINDQGKVEFTSVTEAWKNNLKKMADLYAKGVIDPEFATDSRAIVREKWASGKFGLTVDSTSWFVDTTAGNILSLVQQNDPNAELTYLNPFPASDGNTYVWTVPTRAWTNPAGAFGANCTDEQMYKIMEILDSMVTDLDFYLTTYYGEEGADWNYSELGVITPSENVTPEIKQDKGLNFIHRGEAPKGGNVDKYVSAQGISFFEQYGQFTPYFQGTSFNFTGTNESYNNYFADVQTLTAEFYYNAIVGKIDIDAAWDSYVASLDGVGLQDIIAEYQTYVDENL